MTATCKLKFASVCESGKVGQAVEPPPGELVVQLTASLHTRSQTGMAEVYLRHCGCIPYCCMCVYVTGLPHVRSSCPIAYAHKQSTV